MSIEIDPRESKLPAWAQRELDRLRSEVERRDDTIAALRHEVGETNTYAYNYPADNPLPNGAHVRFAFGDGARQYIEAYHDDDKVVVRGSESIALQPGASNVVYVRLERW